MDEKKGEKRRKWEKEEEGERRKRWEEKERILKPLPWLSNGEERGKKKKRGKEMKKKKR